jgi:serine/threonine protein kinase
MARTVTAAEIEAALGPFTSLDPVGDDSGSGECWRADRAGAVSAIKVVVKEHEPGRFDREVKALERLDSPRVMKVLGSGEMDAAGQTYPYLESEFVDGRTVAAALEGGTPDDDQLRAFLLGALAGLEDLHAAEIVHRDLKPANLILRGDDWGEPVIIDLGLGRLGPASSFTVYPWGGGTLPYMAPEQIRLEPAFDRTDLWALAVIAGELAAGQHPFWRGERQVDLADWDQRLRGGIPIPGARPAALEDWVSRAGDYRAYRRPSASQAREILESSWQ